MIFGYSKLLSKKKCIFEGESIMARTQTLQLQYLYTLSFHLMKVLSLLSFAERLYNASNIDFEKLEKLEKNTKLPERGIEPQISVWKAGLLTIRQGQLQIWTEHSHTDLWNLKPVEISKNHFNIIWTSLKVV